MKSLMLMGGLLGFAIGFAFSWARQNDWPSILLHACLSAYLTGVLLQWWGRAWLRNFASAMNDRRSQPIMPKLAPTSKSAKS
jgi:hypothetical protein